jgi:hypothetical protein
MRVLLLGVAGLALTSCGSAPSGDTPSYTSGEALNQIGPLPDDDDAPPAPQPTAAAIAPEAAGNEAVSFASGAWLGRWQGVQGNYLVVSRGKDPEDYVLEMQYSPDDKGTFAGIGAGEGISFTRPDGVHMLREAKGEATGVAKLAGKQHCLMVRDGEAYCRD